MYRILLYRVIFFYIIFILLALLFLCVNNLIGFYIIGVAFSLITYSFVILPFNTITIEATIKYFFLGALAFSFFLFGSSLIYGIVGSLDITIISYNFDFKNIFVTQYDIIYKLGLLFILFFFLLKMGSFPCHFLLLDVYEGILNINLIFLFLIVKFTFFFMLLRIFVILFFENYNFWFIIMTTLIVGSLLIGTFGAIFEKKLIRFMAYTSISHMSFIFALFLNHSLITILSKSLNYIVIYGLMLVGFFIIYFKIYIFFAKRPLIKVVDLVFLRHFNFNISIFLTIILWSMAGIPPFAGFYIKLFVLESLILECQYELIFFFLSCSTINIFGYVRLLKIIWYDFNFFWGDFFMCSTNIINVFVTNIIEKFLNLILYCIIFVVTTYIFWINFFFFWFFEIAVIFK